VADWPTEEEGVTELDLIFECFEVETEEAEEGGGGDIEEAKPERAVEDRLRLRELREPLPLRLPTAELPLELALSTRIGRFRNTLDIIDNFNIFTVHLDRNPRMDRWMWMAARQ